jgi:FlaA1/EpsC-like NDP-sugar epimerase
MLHRISKAYLKKSMLLLADMMFVLLSLPLSLVIRLDPQPLLSVFQLISVQHYLAIFGAYFVSFVSFRTYRTIIRLANLYTALRVGVAIFVGGVAAFSVCNFVLTSHILPRSTYIIQMLLLVPFCLFNRFFLRIIARFAPTHGHGVHTLIYGAGLTTDRFLPVVLKSKDEIKVYGIIDDDPAKRGSEIQGVKILGNLKDLPRIVAKHEIEQVILSMPSVPGDRMREIADVLYALGLKVKVLPAPEAYLNQINAKTIDIRDLNIEDLLRRAPRNIDKTAIARIIEKKRVLVTGGGGSIGSELVRQIASMNPSQIVVNDASEFALYAISEEIKALFPQLEVLPHLGNLADAPTCSNLFQRHPFDLVFHACAYKHVPLVEANISTSILNNILSAKNIFELSAQHGVQRVVLISSDKAVRPTNVMGATKRIVELMALWFANNQINATKCAFSAVRFGNVLGSSGSVVPKFIEQIKAGGPVQITHPDITRYFMLIPEAVSLVLQAATAISSGEIFVLNMGEPIRIVDMAKDLIRLMGKRLESDIKIEYVGLRPGEKLFEELQLEEEKLQAISEDFFKLSKAMVPGADFMDRVDVLLNMSREGQDEAAKKRLFQLVTEHESEAGLNASLKSLEVSNKTERGDFNVFTKVVPA